MEKLRFLLLTLIIITVFVTKFFFLSIEPQYRQSFIGWLEILLLLFLFIAGILSFLKDIKIPSKEIYRFSGRYTVLFIIIVISLLSFSFFLDFNKKSLDWDSVALYDSRAKIIESGYNFSMMVNLSKWDPKNGYYYLLYPPYTSISDFYWYKFQIPLPISSLYSVYLIFLASVVLLLSIPLLGLNWSLVLVIVTISYSGIFNASLSEYTNLPFDLFLTSGVFLLASYFKTDRRWQLFFGIILVSSSQWVRFLEPIWFSALLAFVLAQRRKGLSSKKLTEIIIFTLTCVLGYLSWNYFTTQIANNPSLYKFNPATVGEPILGIFTGSLLNVSTFFVIYWGTTLATYLISLLILFRKSDVKNNLFFLGQFVLLSVLMYFFGLYLLSFQYDKWREIAGSFVKSSSFLIPIVALIIFLYIKDFIGHTNDHQGRVGNLLKKIYNTLGGK